MAKSKKFTPDYTASDVLGLYTLRANEGDEKRLRQMATSFRQLCRMESEVTIPKQYKAISKEVRTPFVRDAWQRISSSLLAKSPIVHIAPKNEQNKDYRVAANVAERFDTAMIERLNKERGTDLDYTAAAELVRDGESIIKAVHRPDAWGNFPERGKESADDYSQKAEDYKKGTDLPIAVRNVDRMSVVYEGGEYGDEWVIEYGEWTRPYLRSRYGMRDEGPYLVDPKRCLEGKPMPEGLKATSSGRCVKVEFFTAKEWHVIVDGSPAPGFPKANPYAPYLPYFRAPAYEMESLLYSLLFLVPRLDELLTMKLNWSYLGAYPNPIIQTMPNNSGMGALDGAIGNANEAGSGPLTWAPGKAMELPIGKTMQFLVPPPVGRDLNDLVIIFQQLIAIAGIPAVMRGAAQGGDSGYLANQMLAAAQMNYRLATMALQRQREKLHDFSHWMVENVIHQPIYVMGWSEVNGKTGQPSDNAERLWLGLRPAGAGKSANNVADVSKLGPTTVKYRAQLPTDDQARAMVALQLTNSPKPLYGVKDALERLMQEEDPESIMDNMWVEQALNEEPLKSMVMDNALREAKIQKPAPPAPVASAPPPGGGSGLVGPTGAPLMMPGGPQNLQGVPVQNQMTAGTPAIPNLTIPISPRRPGGGRVAGAFPGRPGGPNK